MSNYKKRFMFTANAYAKIFTTPRENLCLECLQKSLCVWERQSVCVRKRLGLHEIRRQECVSECLWEREKERKNVWRESLCVCERKRKWVYVLLWGRDREKGKHRPAQFWSYFWLWLSSGNLEELLPVCFLMFFFYLSTEIDHDGDKVRTTFFMLRCSSTKKGRIPIKGEKKLITKVPLKQDFVKMGALVVNFINKTHW